MDLRHYLQRIEFSGTPKPDLDTLRQIHHQHLLTIPYENLDVQLSRPLDFDIERIFDKLVHRRRGGWCYEMNGLMGWALQQIGFDVTRMSGAVMRASQGDQQLGNHLVLEVNLEQPYLADVGLGDGVREPIPINPGSYRQGYLQHRLELMDDGFWRFHNHAYSNVDSFDFKHAPADEAELSSKCRWLQSAEESPFKMVFIAQRFTPEQIVVQLGKVFTVVAKNGRTSREINNLAEFTRHMRDTFGLHEDFSELWPQIEAAHERFFNEDQAQRP